MPNLSNCSAYLLERNCDIKVIINDDTYVILHNKGKVVIPFSKHFVLQNEYGYIDITHLLARYTTKE